MGYASGKAAIQGKTIHPMDAMSQLQAEHRHIRRLFDRIGHHQQQNDLTVLLQAICDQLTIYLVLKEEVFYPGMRTAATPGQRAQLDESLVEHYTLKVIMDTLDGQAPGDPLFGAKVKTLQRHFTQQANYEEEILFPELQALTTVDFSQRLYDRRRELVEDMREHRLDETSGIR
ncbi:hemerythrin domain-containing protein [Marinobacter nanhaiticus D15-8W]|nr:hemerythrin domain-containing protein [Marinobacter nanhaiticus]BES72306.1 hemerythrin domain-containing protein [Marinobacter nanhaiticus D15-8W]